MHNKLTFYLLGVSKLHRAPGFAFITDAATGIPQTDAAADALVGAVELGVLELCWLGTRGGQWGHASSGGCGTKSVPVAQE